jgi:uncharacterized protein YlxW (UPF0749 family)
MSTQQQRQEWAALAEQLSFFGLEGRAQDAITALLAEVEQIERELVSVRQEGRTYVQGLDSHLEFLPTGNIDTNPY